MIYLIQSNDKLKIGYTIDIKKRLRQYKTHNLDAKLLNSKEGSLFDEQELHRLCSQYKIENEWFEYNEFIINVFNEYISSNLSGLNNTLKKEDFIDRQVINFIDKTNILNTKHIDYISIPLKLIPNEYISIFDIMVYLQIKKNINKETMISKQSVKNLSTIIRASDSTVLESIKKLESINMFSIIKEGCGNKYLFNDDIYNCDYTFVTRDFLDNDKTQISSVLKGYLVCLQKLICKYNDVFILHYSIKELAKIFKMKYSTIRSYNIQLKQLGILNEEYYHDTCFLNKNNVVLIDFNKVNNGNGVLKQFNKTYNNPMYNANL